MISNFLLMCVCMSLFTPYTQQNQTLFRGNVMSAPAYSNLFPPQDAMEQRTIPQEGIYTLMLDSVTGPFTYYNQGDVRWKDYPYGDTGDSLARYGCGPATMAMVVTSLTGELVTPDILCDWSVANGSWCSHSGSYHSLIPDCAAAYGLQAESFKDYTPEGLLGALNSGKLLVALMRRGHFTAQGHFIVLLKATETGQIMIADSATYENTTQAWDPEVILDELNHHASNGGPIWAITVKESY